MQNVFSGSTTRCISLETTRTHAISRQRQHNITIARLCVACASSIHFYYVVVLSFPSTSVRLTFDRPATHPCNFHRGAFVLFVVVLLLCAARWQGMTTALTPSLDAFVICLLCAQTDRIMRAMRAQKSEQSSSQRQCGCCGNNGCSVEKKLSCSARQIGLHPMRALD